MENSELEKIMSNNPAFATAFNNLSKEEQEKFTKSTVKKKNSDEEEAKATGPDILKDENHGL